MAHALRTEEFVVPMKYGSLRYLVLVLVLASVSGYFFLSGGEINPSGNFVVAGNNDAQKITLSMKNYNYYPNTIKVMEGIPVEITLDNSVGGCFRSFVIKDFGVSVYSKTPEEKINFIPNKKGTFRFSCAMGMGTGTLIVE